MSSTPTMHPTLGTKDEQLSPGIKVAILVGAFLFIGVILYLYNSAKVYLKREELHLPPEIIHAPGVEEDIDITFTYKVPSEDEMLYIQNPSRL